MVISAAIPTVDKRGGKPASTTPEDEPARLDDPGRPLNWRWLRAVWLRGRRAALFRDEDKWTLTAKKYLNEVSRIGIRQSWTKLKSLYPGIHRASQLADTDHPDRGLGLQLEAYLLGRAPLTVAAHRCGLTNETALCYKRLFFDVQSRLDRIAWVATQAVGLHGLEHGKLGTQWKAIGWLRGYAYLDYLFATGHIRTADSNDFAGETATLMKESLGVQAMLSARSLTHEGREEKILASGLKMSEIQSASGQDGLGNTDAANIRAVLETFAFAVRPGLAQGQPAPAATEPRAIEMLPAAHPTHTGDSVEWKFPEPAS